MLFQIFIFMFNLDLLAASTPIIIPDNIDFTRINSTVDKWLSKNCGYSSEKTGRQFPWAVSIMLFGEHKLGGTIISPYHILTAAHGACVIWRLRDKKEIDLREVAYGGDCIGGEEQNLFCKNSKMEYNRIKAVMIDFDFATGHCVSGHDWAIIELEHPIKLNENIQPICLPNPMQQIEQNLTVAGWGRVYEHRDNRIHGIPMQSTHRCLIPFPETRPRHVPDYLCALAVNVNGRMVCHGHSGAGLVQNAENRSTIVGITSFGSKGCPASETTIFTRVSIYLHEICYFTGVCYTLNK